MSYIFTKSRNSSDEMGIKRNEEISSRHVSSNELHNDRCNPVHTAHGIRKQNRSMQHRVNHQQHVRTPGGHNNNDTKFPAPMPKKSFAHPPCIEDNTPVPTRLISNIQPNNSVYSDNSLSNRQFQQLQFNWVHYDPQTYTYINSEMNNYSNMKSPKNFTEFDLQISTRISTLNGVDSKIVAKDSFNRQAAMDKVLKRLD